MRDNSSAHNFWFRFVLTVLLVLGGFVFPILFVFAALVGWALISDIRSPTEQIDARFTGRYTTTADDPKWRSYFLSFCESPAEEAFLKAMIDAYNLIPDKGVLHSDNVMLDLQVEMPPYRADFVANNRLVVEIDGAAYHSSPEAITRDKKRDEVMIARGYSVLRIPASVVFAAPREAVRRVGTALKQPRGNGTKPGNQTGGDVAEALLQFTSGIAAFVSETSAKASLKLDVERALAVPRQAFHSERTVIEAAIKAAQRKVDVEKYLSHSEARRRSFNATLQELQEAVKERGSGSGPDRRAERSHGPAPKFFKPSSLSDPETNEAADRAFGHLEQERDEFFATVRQRLTGNDKGLLRSLVHESLHTWGYVEYWNHISCGDSAVDPAAVGSQARS